MELSAGIASGGTPSEMAEFHRPNPKIFWIDLIATASIGWMVFALAAADNTPFWGRVALTLISSAAFYRGLCFLHEIVHMRRSLLRGFETAWNVLFGIPLCMPSVMYVGVHQHHHNLATYGTVEDPEYLPFAGKPAKIVLFVVQSVLLPLLLLLRFLVLSWFGLFVPPFHRWLAQHSTALTMNVKFIRPISKSLMRTVSMQECAVLAFWGIALWPAYAGAIPARAIIIWYAMTALLCTVNSVRTLAAHRYRNGNQPLSREQQLEDSVDIPGGIFTELWAPVGLRYHALHHYFPGIPYHNLAVAYRCINAAHPSYRRSSEKTLAASLRSLITR